MRNIVIFEHRTHFIFWLQPLFYEIDQMGHGLVNKF